MPIQMPLYLVPGHGPAHEETQDAKRDGRTGFSRSSLPSFAGAGVIEHPPRPTVFRYVEMVLIGLCNGSSGFPDFKAHLFGFWTARLWASFRPLWVREIGIYQRVI